MGNEGSVCSWSSIHAPFSEEDNTVGQNNNSIAYYRISDRNMRQTICRKCWEKHGYSLSDFPETDTNGRRLTHAVTEDDLLKENCIVVCDECDEIICE
jgi:hypothetical protein